MEEEEEQESPVSLGRAFNEAQLLFQAIENSTKDGVDPQFQGDVQRALVEFLKISRIVQSEALFSANEELEDISTGTLRFGLFTDRRLLSFARFLLLDFY